MPAVAYGENVVEAAEEWYELLQDTAGKWGELMDRVWADLPPELAVKMLKASTAFADAGDALREVLNIGDNPD